MKTELQDILTDIKAAIRIGHEESLWAALEGLLDFQEVAGNPVMETSFLQKVILPVGKALSDPKLNTKHLDTLAKEPQAALRAIAAVAYAFRWAAGDSEDKELEKLGQDAREDVREAVSIGIAAAARENPEKAAALSEKFISQAKEQLNQTALSIFSQIPNIEVSEVFNVLKRFPAPQSQEVKAGLVDVISHIAQNGGAIGSLELLNSWTDDPEAYGWVICKTLARKWATEHAEDVLDILEKLILAKSELKQVKNTLQAMERHGASNAVQEKLNVWEMGQVELKTFAEIYKS